jgi:hypothetical protein
MKKTAFIICLLSSVFCPLSSRSATNVFLDVTGAVLNERIAQIPLNTAAIASNTAAIASITNTAYSAGLADVGFVDQEISAAFTNANFATFDLSPYVGTNAALVVLRVQAIAASTVSIRTNGDTNNVDTTTMNGAVIGAGETATMIVKTDSAGLIDVKASGNTAMRLVAFIRRHVFD